VSDIFEEVEEARRQDQLQALWKKYGAIVIGAFVALILGVGGYSAYRSWHESASKDASEDFVELQQLATTDPAAAEPKLAAYAKTAHGGYKALAEMERAGVLQAEGDLPGAIAAFEKAATLTNEPAAKHSALLRAAYIAAETENLAALDARVKPLIDGGGAFGFLARELIGVEAYEAGQFERARTEFAYLDAAFDAPQGVRQRAQRFLAVLGPAPATTATPAASAAPAAAQTTGEKK
jgi:hypothetical protein